MQTFNISSYVNYISSILPTEEKVSLLCSRKEETDDINGWFKPKIPATVKIKLDYTKHKRFIHIKALIPQFSELNIQFDLFISHKFSPIKILNKFEYDLEYLVNQTLIINLKFDFIKEQYLKRELCVKSRLLMAKKLMGENLNN